MTPERIKEAIEEYVKCNWANPSMATGEFFEWGDVYGLDLLDHIVELQAENLSRLKLIGKQEGHIQKIEAENAELNADIEDWESNGKDERIFKLEAENKRLRNALEDLDDTMMSGEQGRIIDDALQEQTDAG